jgi:hypothetical protein
MRKIIEFISKNVVLIHNLITQPNIFKNLYKKRRRNIKKNKIILKSFFLYFFYRKPSKN